MSQRHSTTAADDNKEPRSGLRTWNLELNSQKKQMISHSVMMTDVPYEEPVNYSEPYDEETEKADKPVTLETDEVVDSHETSDEEAMVKQSSSSFETSIEPKELEEPVTSEVVMEPL